MKLASTILLIASVATVSVQGAYQLKEHDYDFYGNDIGSWSPAPGPTNDATMDKCFNKCVSWGPPPNSCKAVTFYDGKCYFKSAHGAASYKPGAISSAVYADAAAANNQICPAKIEQNTDYVDNDIGSKKGTAAECCDICKKTPKCRAYSWNNFNEGTCWLKSKRGNTIVKEGVQSALVYPATDVDIPHPLETDIDFVDHDIGNQANVPNPDGCFSLCAKFIGCHAFSWNNDNHGTCWFKTKKDQTVVKSGVTSGVVDTSYPKCVSIQNDKDISGNDLASKNGIPNPDDCPGFCKATTNCVGYVWTDYMGGTCWLKSGLAPVIPKPKAKACLAVV